MANARPWLPPLRLKICELMPITSPRRLNSGPPELPGFTAASVWMNGTYESPGSDRYLALTMPEVTVFSKPYGWPMATTHSPIRVFSGSPTGTTGRSLASIFSTAMSVVLSLPSTFAVNSRLSVSLTVTSSASATTCALVRMTPSGLTMKPEPTPRVGPCCGGIGIGKLRKKGGSSSRSGRSRRCRSCAFSASTVTLMLTTAGPRFAASSLKSGSPDAVVIAAGSATCAAPGLAAALACGNVTRSATATPTASAPARASASALRLKVFDCIAFSLG